MRILMRRSTSRGVNTYGYMVWTATDTETGKRVASANGGGYDIYSTVVCIAFTSQHQDLLKEKFASIDLESEAGQREHYGIRRSSADGHISADGGCGEGVIRTMCKVCGLQFRETKVDDKRYLVEAL